MPCPSLLGILFYRFSYLLQRSYLQMKHTRFLSVDQMNYKGNNDRNFVLQGKLVNLGAVWQCYYFKDQLASTIASIGIINL